MWAGCRLPSNLNRPSYYLRCTSRRRCERVSYYWMWTRLDMHWNRNRHSYYLRCASRRRCERVSYYWMWTRGDLHWNRNRHSYYLRCASWRHSLMKSTFVLLEVCVMATFVNCSIELHPDPPICEQCKKYMLGICIFLREGRIFLEGLLPIFFVRSMFSRFFGATFAHTYYGMGRFHWSPPQPNNISGLGKFQVVS